MYRVITGCLKENIRSESVMQKKGNSFSAFYSVEIYLDACNIYIRYFPVLFQILPGEIWYGVLVIVLVRLLAYVTAAVKFHCFASLHTWMNKLTGVAVFMLPYVVCYSLSVGYCFAVCVLAFVAAAEELAIHFFSTDYLADRKSLLQYRNDGR